MLKHKAVETPPDFDTRFRQNFADLLRWRRDVRHFLTDPIDEHIFQKVMALTNYAPSVGNSQPWRFVRVNDPARRERVIDNFKQVNSAALSDYKGDRAALYAKLKLAGLQEAPVHLAVFSDEGTEQGHKLGRKTMPEMLRYSVVTAVHTLWLAARAYDLGVGWVSILDPEEISVILDIPEEWRLVAYLCIGYPAKKEMTPELELKGWEHRHPENCEVLLR